MKIERIKNASRNVVFGVIQKVYQIVMPFVMRTAMIYLMGIQYLGLSSLFTSILQVLNLAELGVGLAMVYSMYEPIAKDDEYKICALMKLYRIYYRIIGLVVAIIGVILLPYIHNFVAGSVPDNINIQILYLLNLTTTVLSYWLFGYRNCLIVAHQRTDIESKVLLCVNTFQYVLQFAVMILFGNYYLYLLVALLSQILTNIVTAYITTRLYPKYKPIGNMNKDVVKDINHKICDLFTAKLGSVIVNSVDTIVISAFLGLTALAIYQNYYYIILSIKSLMAIFFTACAAGVGNSIIVESREKNYRDLKKITFIILWITGVITACLICLYQPFMQLWVGESLMLGFGEVVCFCIYFYVLEINQILILYKDSAGIWHTDRFRPLLTALVNLTLNLLTVRFWGLYSIILSTCISYIFIGIPWLLHNLFTVLFNKNQLKDYISDLIIYIFTSFIVCMVSLIVCRFDKFGNCLNIFINGVICCIISNSIFLLIYHRRREFYQGIELLNKISNGKIEKILKRRN